MLTHISIECAPPHPISTKRYWGGLCTVSHCKWFTRLFLIISIVFQQSGGILSFPKAYTLQNDTQYVAFIS